MQVRLSYLPMKNLPMYWKNYSEKEDIKMLTSTVAPVKVDKKEAEMEKLAYNFLERWRLMKK